MPPKKLKKQKKRKRTNPVIVINNANIQKNVNKKGTGRRRDYPVKNIPVPIQVIQGNSMFQNDLLDRIKGLENLRRITNNPVINPPPDKSNEPIVPVAYDVPEAELPPDVPEDELPPEEEIPLATTPKRKVPPIPEETDDDIADDASVDTVMYGNNENQQTTRQLELQKLLLYDVKAIAKELKIPQSYKMNKTTLINAIIQREFGLV